MQIVLLRSFAHDPKARTLLDSLPGVVPTTAGLILTAFCLALHGQAQTPALTARQTEIGRVQLSWPAGTDEFVLEQTPRLGAGAQWSAVSGSPTLADGQRTLSLAITESALYFRLRGSARPALTRVTTSPAPGAGGISVNRETIFRFSNALAADTTLPANLVYAEVGSRRLLSRAELASDRRKLTVFYLEPLPAGSRIRVRLDGNQLRDANGSLVDADGDGVPGGLADLNFDTMNSVLLPGTAVSGYVYDSAAVATPTGSTNKPVVGAIITIDGNEQLARAVSDENGFFILSPCPTGRFFVHVDGREAVGSGWPDGAYYPFIGKTFEGTASQTNVVPGGAIYLPLVPAAALQPVSTLTATEVELPAAVLASQPELAGLKVTVPRNALFADDGSRGGRVGIAPVPPNRLPSPLPPGLEPAVVITVQTDGPSNFDQPVPVQFPNLPDPRTGRVLAPGEKSVLWSFNHDSGQWEPQGTMTVSADGKLLVSDPGVGILQPGWHGPLAVWPPIPPPPSSNTNCPVSQLAQEYVEAQLKQAECGLRMAALFTLTGPSVLLGPGLQVVANASGLMTAMAQNLSTLSTALQSGQPATALGALAGIVGANLSALSQTVSLLTLKSKDPLKNDLAVCLLEFLKEQSDFSCGIVPCLFSNHPNFANQMALCNSMQTALQNALNAIQAYQFSQGGAYSRLSLALQNMNQLLTAYGALPTGPNRPALQSNASLETQIQAQINEALVALAELQTELEPSVEFATLMLETLNTYSNVLATIDGPALLRLNAHANGYYKLTSGTFSSRGRISPSGTMTLPGVGLTEGFSFQIYDPARNAVSDGIAPAPGISRLETIGNNLLYLPDPVLRLPGINDLSGDTDGDGLTDLAEDVIGTRRDVSDTDGDGVSDFAEAQRGQDPLSGVALPIGPVAAVSLQGVSRAIDIAGTTAYLAQGNSGMAIVDLADPLNPILLSQFTLPGYSRDIAYSPTARTAGLVAYASSDQIAQGESAQIHILDLADPSSPRLIRTLLTPATTIKEHDGIFYVGVDDQVRMYDATSGLEVGWLGAGALVTGILPTEGAVFVTTSTTLSVFENRLLSPALKGRLTGKFAAADVESSVPMVLDGSRLWVGTATGLLAVDISNPATPRALNQPGSAPQAFRTLALTAGKRAVALTTFTPNASNFGGNTSLFDISDPTSNNRPNLLLTGRGAASDAALMAGWFVLADGLAGLTVMNLQGVDTAGVAPSIAWTLDPQDVDPQKSGVQLIEGSEVVFRPQVTDDLEVDFTELLADGAVVGVSRIIPPVFHYPLPTRADGLSLINLQIRSRDRSGNLSISEGLVVELVPDTQPPAPLSPTERSGMAAFAGWPIAFRFSEPLLPEAWQASSMSLMNLGANGVQGGGDDTAVTLAAARVTSASASVVPATPLSFGRYRLTIPKECIRDAVSNAPTADLVFEFQAFATDPATAVWISPTAGRYHEATNWFPARVPNQVDVLIQLAGPTPEVTLDGRAIIKNLTVAGALSASNRFASLVVTRGARFLGPVSWNVGTMTVQTLGETGSAIFEQALSLGAAATFTALSTIETKASLSLTGGVIFALDGTSARLVPAGEVRIANSTLVVRSGAVLDLPQFTSFDSPGDFTPLFPVAAGFRAQGAGSRLSLPNLTTASGPTQSNVRGAPSLRFEAIDGAQLQLPKLTALTGRTALISDGFGSVLDAPLLRSVAGPASPVLAVIEASNDGRIQVPALTTTENVNLTERTGGTIVRGTP